MEWPAQMFFVFSSETFALFPASAFFCQSTVSKLSIMSAFIIGSTGLCGNFILKHSPEYYKNVFSLSRSEPDNASDSKIQVILEKDSTKWAEKLQEAEGPIDAFFSGLGTTRAKAGGLDKQYKIDYDLNLEMAKAAKAKGVKKYILISSIGASSGSMFPYMKMKGELEDAVLKMDFENTIILRPGLLLGERKEQKWFGNRYFGIVAGWTAGTPLARFAMSPIHGEDVALAALKLAAKPTTAKVNIVTGVEVNAAAK